MSDTAKRKYAPLGRRIIKAMHRFVNWIDREYSLRFCRHRDMFGQCCYCHLNMAYIRERETTHYA